MKKLQLIICFLFASYHTLSAQQTIFSDGFESGQFDSTANGYWTAHPGDNGGVIAVDDNLNSIALGHNGVYGVALGRETRGAWTTNALDLHLDLSGQSQVELSFWIKDTGEDANDEDGIWFSDNGGASFVKVFDFRPNLWVDNEYGQFPPLDLDALAAEKNLMLTDQFIVRFQQYAWYEFGVRGIYLDDVSVTVPNISYAILPFEDDFEDGSLGTAWTWANPEFPTLTTVPGTVVPGGRVMVASNVNGVEASHLGLNGLALGNAIRGAWTTNAIDLHLDLSGQSQVELNFWIKDTDEATHDEDGIWFSDNGGASFVKVVDFRPNLWVNNAYGPYPPIDLDALAAANNLKLTDRFIVRFQQYDWYEFGVRGIYLDNVSVTTPEIIYATLPFEDNFETGNLGAAWAKANPEFPALTTTPETALPSGRVVVTSNINGVEASYRGLNGLALGNAIQGAWTTNAIDLHLNLSGQNQVELSFWIKDTGDETHDEDGIWYSPNGGLVFKKIFSLNPRVYPNNVFSQLTLNLDSLIQSIGLNLTDKSILRFQHYGWYALGRDGFYIDDVLIKSATSTDIKDINPGVPSAFTLHQNYPNPFNPATNIRYDLPNSAQVNLAIYTLLGEKVRTLVAGQQPAGAHTVQWDGRDEAGAQVASGVYFYQISAQDASGLQQLNQSRKLLLLR